MVAQDQTSIEPSPNAGEMARIARAKALSVVYKTAQSDAVAKSALRVFMKKFYIHAIGNNHRRYIKSIRSFCFMDVPGSRRGWTSQFEIASAQGNFHHHIILLMEGVAEKKMSRWFAEAENVEFRELNQTTPARNHMLQELATLDDIRRCAAYASKSVQRLNSRFEDAYLLPSDTTLLPKPVMLLPTIWRTQCFPFHTQFE
jgi:hypothetical protein